MASPHPPDADAQNAKLTELTTAAHLQYSLKNYAAAADLYSEATELQATISGEMAPANADLLYAYGRCLYHVAVANSDVLGGKVAGEAGAAERSSSNAVTTAKSKAVNEGSGGPAQRTNGEGSANGTTAAAPVANEAGAAGDKDSLDAVYRPFFQFNGDEVWDDSDDEDADAEDGAGADGDAAKQEAEDDDDFKTAFEILDLARLLLSRQLEALTSSIVADSDKSTGKGKAPAAPTLPQPSTSSWPSADTAATTTTTDQTIRHLQERLADTHDLQAEIALENERFADAVTDSRAALALKQALHPPESSLVAEAHFKLSLALEFASVTTTADADEGDEAEAAGNQNGQGGKGKKEAKSEGEQHVDEEMRAEAARQMEAAIESCRLRVRMEEAEADAMQADSPDAIAKRRSIQDVKEMIEEMEQRVCLNQSLYSCPFARSLSTPSMTKLTTRTAPRPQPIPPPRLSHRRRRLFRPCRLSHEHHPRRPGRAAARASGGGDA